MLVLFETAAGYALFKVCLASLSPPLSLRPSTPLDCKCACGHDPSLSVRAQSTGERTWLDTDMSVATFRDMHLQMKKGFQPQEEDMHDLFATPELAQEAIKLKVRPRQALPLASAPFFTHAISAIALSLLSVIVTCGRCNLCSATTRALQRTHSPHIRACGVLPRRDSPNSQTRPRRWRR
jgi:hypothetical protein